MKTQDEEPQPPGANKRKSGQINPLSGRTILLVNTGYIKKRFIIQRLKKLGLKLVVINKEKNWAQGYVDHWILADNTRHDEALETIEKFISTHPEIKIDGALTFWEDDVLLTSKIIDKYHLKGIPFSIAKKVRNKYKFRDFCNNNNLPAPRYKLLKNDKDIEYINKNFKYPLVIKPALGSSSAYVVKVDDPEELLKILHYIKNTLSTSIESALTDGFDILAEEYIDGDEVDIDIIIQNGKIKYYSITDNDKTKEPFFVETGDSIPSSLPEKDQNALINLADETLEKLGIQNGCIHFEAKSTKYGPVPIEINLRMGGDQTFEYVKKAWGMDLIENAAKVALGIYIPKICRPESPRKYLIGSYFLAPYSGILHRYTIAPELKNKDYVEDLQFFKEVGDPVLAPPEGYEYLGWIVVSGENMVDTKDNLDEALKHINYDVAKFQPTSSIGKTQRKNGLTFSTMNKHMLIRGSKIEKLRRMSINNQRNLHIGVVCNLFDNNDGEIEKELSAYGKIIQNTLHDRGYNVSFFDFNNLPKAFNELKKTDIDLAYNVCERINDSSLLEPHAASILDTLQIPYTGSNPFTLSLCIDKIRVKKLLSFHNIPTPKWDYAYCLDDDIRSDLKYPIILKPANTDNSIGITNDSVVTNRKDLMKQLEKILVEFKRPALIEEYIEGDEYDVSILGSEEDDLRVLPLSRSIFNKMPDGYWHIFPFEAKYSTDTIYKNGITIQRPPKNISKKLIQLLSEIALDTYNILDCHDYGRVEIRVDKNNNPYVLELNPNPSIGMGCCVPEVAKLVGMDYGDFLEEIIRLAVKRYKDHPPYYHLQPNMM
ncbi:ATP-grasp domain-containing protein [Candidatus Peregrinibacteria bacterium]|nr:ATP-grasp domain-containing protein [Candidatus Peregrinibacteria bacterium]